MPATVPDLISGQPAFADGSMPATAARQAAAWRAAFARDGLAAPAAVHGAFAVAVALDDGRVFMAVDRFATHPVCWRADGGVLRFACRADALAHDSPALDSQALFDYLYFHVIPSPSTVFDGVYRLPPGHCALWQGGRLTVQPYWVPTFTPPARRPAFAALRDEFLGLLSQAVRRQLDGSKPACFLSGGTDSSTVAGLIRKVSGQAPATYSIGFDAQGYDEMGYARIAARHFGTDHHEYYVTPDDLVRSIPIVAAHYDQPFGNSSAVPAFHCAQMAQQDGVTRLLAGDGGDELFGGNTRYAKQRVFGWYASVPGALRAVLQPVFGARPVAATPLLGKVSSYIAQARVPMPQRQQTYNLLQRLGVADVLTPGFLRQVDQAAPDAQQRDVWAQAHAATLLDRQLAFDWRYTLAENDLPKVCGTAALAQVSVGFPLLDRDLLDFSSRLPTAYKLRGMKLRWFFKEALRGFLPDEIIVKKKQGFGLPFGVWAHRHAGLNALARDALESLGTRGMVRPVFVQTLMDQRLAEHPGYYGEMVWILMMLEHWLRAHRPGFQVSA